MPVLVRVGATIGAVLGAALWGIGYSVNRYAWSGLPAAPAVPILQKPLRWLLACEAIFMAGGVMFGLFVTFI